MKSTDEKSRDRWFIISIFVMCLVSIVGIGYQFYELFNQIGSHGIIPYGMFGIIASVPFFIKSIW